MPLQEGMHPCRQRITEEDTREAMVDHLTEAVTVDPHHRTTTKEVGIMTVVATVIGVGTAIEVVIEVAIVTVGVTKTTSLVTKTIGEATTGHTAVVITVVATVIVVVTMTEVATRDVVATMTEDVEITVTMGTEAIKVVHHKVLQALTSLPPTMVVQVCQAAVAGML